MQERQESSQFVLLESIKRGSQELHSRNAFPVGHLKTEMVLAMGGLSPCSVDSSGILSGKNS